MVDNRVQQGSKIAVVGRYHACHRDCYMVLQLHVVLASCVKTKLSPLDFVVPDAGINGNAGARHIISPLRHEWCLRRLPAAVRMYENNNGS